jgi:hypothetical protein
LYSLCKDKLSLKPIIVLVADLMSGEGNVVCWRKTNRVCDNLDWRWKTMSPRSSGESMIMRGTVEDTKEETTMVLSYKDHH